MDTPPEDKEWATKYLLDPLTAPEPSQETGPGSHFRSTTTAKPLNHSSSTSKTPSATVTSETATAQTYPTPPNSASPTSSTFHPSNPYSPSHRQVSFNPAVSRKPIDKATTTTTSPSTAKSPTTNTHRRRGSSLNERYPGDMSHRPLAQIRASAKAADRSPHLKRHHLPPADAIDILDRSVPGGAYHHEGPYDATLLARNTSFANSPVEAVRASNEEALKATPKEYVRDALDKHVPLQGTAVVPSGMRGPDGRVMRYEEGADLMREEDAPGGAYRRWEGVKYLPEDYKGKGEPSFSIERALKQKDAEAAISGRTEGNSYEMHTPLKDGLSRQRSVSGSGAAELGQDGYGSGEVRRSNTTGRKIGEGLKRRLGSLRRSKRNEA